MMHALAVLLIVAAIAVFTVTGIHALLERGRKRLRWAVWWLSLIGGRLFARLLLWSAPEHQEKPAAAPEPASRPPFEDAPKPAETDPSMSGLTAEFSPVRDTGRRRARKLLGRPHSVVRDFPAEPPRPFATTTTGSNAR